MRLSVVQMSFIPKSIDRFNTIQINIMVGFFGGKNPQVNTIIHMKVLPEESNSEKEDQN